MPIFKAARRATSLLHWRVDPEIYPLVGALTVAGAVGAYTVSTHRTNFIRNLVPQESNMEHQERNSKEHKIRIDPEKIKRIGVSLGIKEN